MRTGAWGLVALVALASAVAQAFGRFTYSLVLPSIERELAGSYAVAGVVGAVNVAAYVLAVLVVGTLGRRLRPATWIRLGLACCTGGLVLLTRSATVPELAAGLALTGWGAALIWLPSPGFVGGVVAASRRGAAIGLIGSGIGLGIVFAGGLTSLRAGGGDSGWRGVYLVETVFAVLVLGACLGFLRAGPRSPAEEPGRPVSLRQVPGWRGLAGGYAAYGLAYSIYTSYLVAALEDAGFSPGHASAVYTVVGAALVVGGVLLGQLSDRWGRGQALVLGHLLMAGAILLVLAGAEPLATVSALVFGAMMSGLPSVVAARLADVLPRREFSAVFARCTLAFALAQTCGTSMGGFLAEASGGFALPFAVAAAMSVAGAVLSIDVLRAGRGPDRPAAVGDPGAARDGTPTAG
ncbi:MFS transporter [Geodermatophilus sp. CPCC 206100]|uniref:MFS transporter n=1 Tax=Geodermatophilus sp. CPCC 206100 TaxID=3020054 RepID=UPI003B0053A5